MKLSKDLIAVGTGDQSLAGVKQRLAQWRTSRVRGERMALIDCFRWSRRRACA
jgi:hypothetical protein